MEIKKFSFCLPEPNCHKMRLTADTVCDKMRTIKIACPRQSNLSFHFYFKTALRTVSHCAEGCFQRE